MQFISKHDILYSKKFGFRLNNPTILAILIITDKIQKAIDSGMFTCGIFLDLSKAFDTVNHKILLQKLECYGIRGVAKRWFESYLNNRQQFVSLGNVKSETKAISCGVPQGSVLGPILFLLCVNDFQNCSKILYFHLFADDTNLFLAHKSIATLEKETSEQLNLVHEWLCANKLSLIIEKSNFVIFHQAQKKLTYAVNIAINDKFLKYEDNIKCLGVLIDKNLNWKSHVSFLSKKIKRNIGAISKFRHFVNRDILINLYYALLNTSLFYLWHFSLG